MCVVVFLSPLQYTTSHFIQFNSRSEDPRTVQHWMDELY